MKKILTFLVTALLTTIASSAQTSQLGPVKAQRYASDAKQFSIENALKAAPSVMQQPSKAAKFSGQDGYVDAYGYVLYDNRFRSYIWSKFNTADPKGYSMVRDYGTAQGADVYQTATFVGDRVFAQRCYLYFQGYWVPRSFGWFDPETTEFDECFEWITLDNLFRDMTYDPVSNKIYLVDTNNEFTAADIYTIDPDNPSNPELAFTVNEGMVMLSADNGILYGIIPNELGKSNTRLVKINTNSINTDTKTCTLEEIRKSGMGISIAFDQGNGMPQLYWQSMEFDKTNHRLWWNANTTDGNSRMCEIDYKKGVLISNEQLPTNPEFVGLCMPYQTADVNAPSYVRNLTAEAGANGAATAKFTWVNPTQTYMNEQLTSLSGVKVYRDDQLVNTVSTTSVGANVTFDDTNVPTGNHHYKFLTYNEAGDGIYKDVDLFVGHDTPNRVGMLTLEAQGNDARISWNAPTDGQHGGWIDAASLKYKVVRFPENIVVAEDITETSFVDNTITEWKGYYYEVTPSTADGDGMTAATNVLPMGPALSIPYTNDMSTKDLFNQWQVIDNNYGYGDGTKWEFDSFRKLAYYFGSLNPADDYLVSPKFNFEAGKEYQLRYTYYTSNWVDGNHDPIMEKMHVYYGQQPNPEGLSTLVKDLGEFHTSSANYLYGKDNFTPQAGEGYVAFKAVSDPDRGVIYLYDISIREYSDKDLSVAGMSASSIANAGVAQNAVVEVANEGKAAVSNYKVEVFNVADGEVLGTANGVNVGVGEKKNVTVQWTPAEPMTINISARVVLEGDTYPADNEWNSSLEVTVADKDGAKWFAANSDDKVSDPIYGNLNVGWNGPFHFQIAASEVQQIFLESELRKGVLLKGVQFVYDGNPEIEGEEFPVTISVKPTTRSTIANAGDEGMADFDYSGWIDVFDGNITLDGTKENSLLTIMFDTPYQYNGGNLMVRYQRHLSGSIAQENMPYWHFHCYADNEPYRTGFYRNENSEYADPGWTFTYQYATHTRFAYEDDPASVNNARTSSLLISQSGDNIMLSATCEQVEMYSTSGARVLAAKNVNNFSTRSLAKGVYTLKAKVNGQVVSKKLVVR